MSFLTKRSNDALNANPNVFTYPTMSDINITTHGSDVYWAVCAVMIVSTMGFAGWAFTVPRSKRIFHYITASITMVAAVAYFTMGSNLGYAAIPVEFRRSRAVVAGNIREVFYVRYIDWVVTTPLLLLDILLTAGLPWPTILYTILIDEIMIITGLVGALVASSYKWGYFVFAMFALFYIGYELLWVGRLHSRHFGPAIARTYMLCGGWTIFLWFLYPVAWGLAEGGNIISPDSEAVFYGILDVLAKPGFGIILLMGHRNIDPTVLGLQIHDYDEVDSANIGHKEKHSNGTHAVSGGTDNTVLGDHTNTATGATNTAPVSTGGNNV